jgi:hypothetical protein
MARRAGGTWLAILGRMWRSSLVALLLVACGGVVEGGSRQDGEEEKPSTNPGQDPAPSDDDGLDDPDADTQLGECKLGPEEGRAPCAWVTDRRCYETRQMACNCACPRDRNSQCSSGFESGPDGHVWVSCR